MAKNGKRRDAALKSYDRKQDYPLEEAVQSGAPAGDRQI